MWTHPTTTESLLSDSLLAWSRIEVTSKELSAFFLISHGANLNHKDNNNATPLHKATMNANPRLVKKLVTRGADPFAKMIEDQTPYSIAKNEEFDNLLPFLVGVVFMQRGKPNCLGACYDITSQDNVLNHSRLRLYSSIGFLLFVLLPLLPILLPCK